LIQPSVNPDYGLNPEKSGSIPEYPDARIYLSGLDFVAESVHCLLNQGHDPQGVDLQLLAVPENNKHGFKQLWCNSVLPDG
jgi:hypothetical protein